MKKKKDSKVSKSTIFLIISCVLLLISISIFGYLLIQNKKTTKELDDLKTSITKAKEKISNDEKELEEKENQHEKLQEELKEKTEELEIWKETKEKLESSLQ